MKKLKKLDRSIKPSLPSAEGVSDAALDDASRKVFDPVQNAAADISRSSPTPFERVQTETLELLRFADPQNHTELRSRARNAVNEREITNVLYRLIIHLLQKDEDPARKALIRTLRMILGENADGPEPGNETHEG